MEHGASETQYGPNTDSLQMQFWRLKVHHMKQMLLCSYIAFELIIANLCHNHLISAKLIFLDPLCRQFPPRCPTLDPAQVAAG